MAVEVSVTLKIVQFIFIITNGILFQHDQNQPANYNKLNAKLITVFIATTLGTSVPVGFHLGVVNAPADVSNTFNYIYVIL